MKLNKRATGALAAAAALLAIPAVGGTAHATTYAGTLHRGWTTGVPTTVHRGQTITVELWFKQTSPYVLHVGGYAFDIWNPAGVNKWGSSAPGVTVTWLDPNTKKWVPSDLKLDKGSEQLLTPAGPEVKVPSGVWNHIYARITFARTVQLGRWTLEAVAPQSWELTTASGRGTSAILKGEGWHLQTITVLR
ncbi:hypothetical protein [Streptacidiphilus jiangxiensis]|uniref:Uncharacterized protein n=1 Tax=Streptacidiphilus jiangxiensis TaxID=235985 RepID=A0A1H7PWD8_STRJI|nr:hypothetical protein [Streptacidiphilus jiangxiensis]SEL40053.1 hypothetical protein SAMN05414137_108161 [Streptacidiphilus jiangxiensis]